MMKIMYPKIAREIDLMAKKDQEVREKYFQSDNKSVERYMVEVQPVDLENISRLKDFVREIGFLGISKVGKKASFNAWLIVQHSPDHMFMEKYLSIMEEQPEDEYDSKNFAYLKDRVLFNQGKSQIYGTQVVVDDKTGKAELYRVSDRNNLNTRRAEVGLETVEEYLKNYDI